MDHFHTQVEDGLAVPWHGLVWLNPPYSAPAPWLVRLRDHGMGVALIPNDSSTSWWQESVPGSSAVCFVAGRVKFAGGTDLLSAASLKANSSARFPSLLVAFGRVAGVAVLGCGLGFTVKP